MESETTCKRLMYTLIKNINCIQILGWDHDICNSLRNDHLSIKHLDSIELEHVYVIIRHN